jgi:hypothetical protein
MLFAAGLAITPAAGQVPPGGVPIPSPADFGDPDDLFGAEGDVDGEWAVITGFNREAFFVYQRVAGIWTRRQRIVPPTLGQSGIRSINIRGNRLLIARAFGEGFAGQGRVWVYERTAPGADFSLSATITPDSGQAGDRFGYGLSQSEDRIFLGAPGRQETVANQGAAYVFRLDAGSWVQEQKLVMPDPTVTDRFGFDLAFDGQDILVGARQHRPPGGASTRRGAVYVYRLQAGTWTLVQKLEQPVALTQGTQFGYAVSASNGRAAIVGPGGGVGAVYAAERDAGGVWSYDALPDPLAGTGRRASFMNTVDLDGDLIAVAVSLTNDTAPPNAAGPGYAVIWRRSGGSWAVTAQLQRTDGVLGQSFFGDAAVRLGAGWLLSGSIGDNASTSNPRQGSVLSYSLVDGVATPRQRLWHGSGNRPDNLGDGVAIDGDHAIATAPGADTAGAALDLGAVHFLARSGAGSWSFVQAFPGTVESGAPSHVALSADLGYVAYPAAQAAGLPAPIIRVYRRDGTGTWAPLCDLQPPLGTTRPVEALRASPVGALMVLDGNRVAFWPPPTGATCPTGTLLPPAPQGFYLGANLTGSVAVLEWQRQAPEGNYRGIDVYDLISGTWTLAQSFSGTTMIGLTIEGYEAGKADAANRLLMIHKVPVTSLDSRRDAQIWTRPAIGSPYTLTRTFTSPTPTSGFQGGFFVDSAVFLADPSIGLNWGFSVFNTVSGAFVQSLVPAGLTVEDDLLNQADCAGSRCILAASRKNRSNVNHAGLVYMTEPVTIRGAPATYGVQVPQALPPAGPDAMFFDGMEITAF